MPIKVNITLPFDRIDHGSEFTTPEAVAEVASAAERSGFYSGLVTDHPCPTGRWLDAGGHHAQDPFVLLAFVAAATKSLRLQTGIVVLPYRNPFITARAVSTLDVLSKGRVSLGVGAGYLKGEYRALGVDFERRNDLTDEYIRAMKLAWTEEEFTFQGSGYEALGNRVLPHPIQRPHPPVLVGGNSKRAIRRAAELGDAWNPCFYSGQIAATSRTAEIKDESDLAEAISYLRQHCEKINRPIPPEIVLCSFNSSGDAWNADELIEKAARFEALGINAVAASIAGQSRAEWCENAERFGAEVVAKIQ